jgi:pimeloyl-ACP methyl ester carboxylesterase
MTPWNSRTLKHDIHALAGGSGTAVVLIPGWPQTAEAYGDIFSSLAEHHHVFAIDPPGIGDSAPSTSGYDTGTISRILQESVRAATDERYHLVGHDVGAWIAYAWAAQFPARLKSLTVLDAAIPGLGAQFSFPLPYEVNLKLWQFSFNVLPDLPEVLTRGRERELLDWLFDRKSQHPERLSREKRDRYVECYSRPGGMSQGFAYYRATAESARQNIAFSKSKLQMPVLALGAKKGGGDTLWKSMGDLAVIVEGGEIDDCGHYLLEEQPEQVATKLLDFFRTVERAR